MQLGRNSVWASVARLWQDAEQSSGKLRRIRAGKTRRTRGGERRAIDLQIWRQWRQGVDDVETALCLIRR